MVKPWLLALTVAGMILTGPVRASNQGLTIFNLRYS